MTQPLSVRLARIDAVIDEERARREQCGEACREEQYLWHETKIDRLLNIRDILAAGGILTASEDT